MTTPTRKRPAVKVTPLAEEGFVVRAPDVERAKAALAEWLGNNNDQFFFSAEKDPAAAIAEYMDRHTYRAGWFRWNPCHPSSCYDGGGHCGHLMQVSAPGRGVWLGVQAYA